MGRNVLEIVIHLKIKYKYLWKIDLYVYKWISQWICQNRLKMVKLKPKNHSVIFSSSAKKYFENE